MIGYDPEKHILVMTREGTDDLERLFGPEYAQVLKALAAVRSSASGAPSRRVVNYSIGICHFVPCTIDGLDVELRLVHGYKNGEPIAAPCGRLFVFVRGCRLPAY